LVSCGAMGSDILMEGGESRLAISKERKEELVTEYTDLLQRSQALVITEFRGLSNAEMSRLRNQVREANGVYRVTKLTLLRLAMEQAGLSIPEEMLDGPIALGFCMDQVPPVAKTLVDYAVDSDFLIVKGGVLGGKLLTGEQVSSLAALPSLDEVRAQLLSLLSTQAANLLGVLASGVRQVMDVINAYVETGAGAPAAEVGTGTEPVT
jgi:large subunit ribosomal protein L10